MSDSLSLIYVDNFARRIRGICVEENEIFIRELLAEVVVDCPLGLLIDLSIATLNYRKAELENEAQDN